MTRKMIPVSQSIEKWRQDPDFVAAYDALEEEFSLAAAMIDARKNDDLSQADVAERMGVPQPNIARLESGRGNPSLRTLQRYAKATGTQLKIIFERPQKRG